MMNCMMITGVHSKAMETDTVKKLWLNEKRYKRFLVCIGPMQ